MQGELEKKRKFDHAAFAQGDLFSPLCVEDGGRLGDQSLEFLKLLCDRKRASGDTSFNCHSFLRFAKSVLHVANLKAVARVIQQNAQLMTPPSLLQSALRLPGASHLPPCPCPYHPRPPGSVLPRLTTSSSPSLPSWAYPSAEASSGPSSQAASSSLASGSVPRPPSISSGTQAPTETVVTDSLYAQPPW